MSQKHPLYNKIFNYLKRNSKGISFDNGLRAIISLTSLFSQHAQIEYGPKIFTGLCFYFATCNNTQHNSQKLSEFIYDCYLNVSKSCFKKESICQITNSFLGDPTFTYMAKAPFILGSTV